MHKIIKNYLNMVLTWKGIYSTITTKFNQDVKLDFNLCRKNHEFQQEAGFYG